MFVNIIMYQRECVSGHLQYRDLDNLIRMETVLETKKIFVISVKILFPVLSLARQNMK